MRKRNKTHKKIEYSEKPNFKIGITHSDKFHADDIFSTALLKLLCPDIKIIRKRRIEKKLFSNKDIIIYDVGDGQFDHHSENKETRPDGTPYASFGKLWKTFGIYLVDREDDVEYIDNVLVRWIDSTDNGGPPNTLTSAIKAFNPCWDDNDIEAEKQFDRAVDLAMQILSAYIKKKKSERRADKLIEQTSKVQRCGLLVLDSNVPLGKNIEPNVYFVIYPFKNKYVLKSIVDSKTKKPRMKIPSEWSNKQPKGCLYIINNGEAHFGSLESAIEAGNSILNCTEILDVNKILDLLRKYDYKIYDTKNNEFIESYGIVVLDSNNIVCPILSNVGFYSLSSMDYNPVKERFEMNNDYYGMVQYGIEDTSDIGLHVFYDRKEPISFK